MMGNVESALMGNYGHPVYEMVRGEGVYLHDSEGQEYLDFTAGIAVCSLGHAHPAVTEALISQANTLLHTSNLYRNPERTRLAARLAELSGLDKVFFCNSGTEANEAALKLARRYAFVSGDTKRTQFVSLPGGFHGRTFGSLSVTPKPAYQEGFQPLLDGCTTPRTWADAVQEITDKTAGCIVEVVQGEGGVRPVPADVLQAIAARCKETGTLLIVDEVQTGVGRTGAFFAFEDAGIKPDIVTMAKGLANGVPVGAVLANAEVASAFTPGSHGTTFGGNLLAVAAAHVVLDYVAEAAFLTKVRETGAYLAERLHSRFEEVTGKGLMWGFTVDNASGFVSDAANQGLLLTAVGPNRIRMVPPLIATKAHVDEAMRRLEGVR